MVFMVNHSPVKKAVIMPENVPMNNAGKPNVTITSSFFRCLITRLTPSVRVHTRRMPSEEKNDKIMISILVSCVHVHV